MRQTVGKEGRYVLGANRLRRWLQNQAPYSLNRVYRPHAIERSRVIVAGRYDQFDADLADFRSLSEYNDGQNYLLIVIDVFSRFCWVEGLETKENVEVKEALERILARTGRIPRRLRTDNGKEFTTEAMQQFYTQYNITHFVAMNEVKANYAERVIKTLKSKLYRYMQMHQTYRYKEVVQDIVHSYNNTYHKNIKMTPSEVTNDNEKPLWWMQYHPKRKFQEGPRKMDFKFRPGDHVRIPHVSTVFGREWSARWTEEVFVVSDRFRRQGINMYKVEDEDNEPVYGTFYELELQGVVQHLGKKKKKQNDDGGGDDDDDDDDVWKVDKILRTRRDQQHPQQQQQALVSFKGWPAFYNRWIPYETAQNEIAKQTRHTLTRRDQIEARRIERRNKLREKQKRQQRKEDRLLRYRQLYGQRENPAPGGQRAAAATAFQRIRQQRRRDQQQQQQQQQI